MGCFAVRKREEEDAKEEDLKIVCFCSSACLKVIAYVFVSVAIFSLALILWDLKSATNSH